MENCDGNTQIFFCLSRLGVFQAVHFFTICYTVYSSETVQVISYSVGCEVMFSEPVIICNLLRNQIGQEPGL